MIQGLSIEQLARDVVARKATMRDFHVPSSQIEFCVNRELSGNGNAVPRVRFGLNGSAQVGTLTDYAFRQITSFAGIPAQYVDRMLERESLDKLVKDNVTMWLRELAEKRFVRAYQRENGELTIRAFLSDKYKPLDYLDLLEAIMPILRERQLIVKSAQVTETRLYIQAVAQDIQAMIPRVKGGELAMRDACSPGVVISNSEVGAGSVRVEPMIYRLVCTNGMIAGTGLRKYHVGRAQGGGDDASEFFSDETKKLTDAATWAQVRDVVGGALDREKFEAIVQKFGNAENVELPSVQKAVEESSKLFGMTKDEQDAILKHLIDGGDGANLFGLVNAVTRSAQDASSYDRAIELERIGGQMLDVNPANVAKWTN